MSEQRLRELGRVASAEVFIEDHGLLTFFVNLEFGGSGQGFGGHSLCDWDPVKKRRVGTAAGLDLLLRLLALFGVDRLEKAKGKPVYAIREDAWGSIVGLETPEFDGSRRFLLSEWRAEWFPVKATCPVSS